VARDEVVYCDKGVLMSCIRLNNGIIVVYIHCDRLVMIVRLEIAYP